MFSLVLDSSYKDLVVGLVKNGEVIENINYECFQRQSELMIVEINNALKRNDINPKEIGEILVALGPGSYTGVRIALTIAKVYSYALKIPCYAYSSLKILQDYSKPSICLINARSSRSYIGVYDKNKILLNDQVMRNEEVIKYIENHRDFALCGDLDYLELDGYKANIPFNMINLKNDDDLVKDIMTLKAVYLKD